ncbi:MAG: membrane protein insertase YidC [Moraxella sp.]|nr:membrane protein insertase YidC [Moraxella sp.]
MQKIFRTLIIVAMLITSYLLVLAWQKDYGGQASSVDSTTKTASSSGDLAVSTTGDLPASTNVATPADVNTDSNLISVSTDVYDIKINPIGGDVVYAGLKKYAKTLGGSEPFAILESGARTYVAQSLIGGTDGIDTQAARATYTSPSQSYTLTGDSLTVPLTYTKDGLSVTKTYTFKKGEYPIQLTHTINNASAKDFNGELFMQLKRDDSKDPGLADKGMMGIATHLGGAWGTTDEPYHKLKFKDFNDGEITQNTQNSKDGWVAMVQHYFVSALAPKNHSPVFFSRTNGADNYIGYQSPIIVSSGKQLNLEDTLYVGPKVQSELALVAPSLDKTVDYGVFWPISKPIFMLLEALYKVLGNWGWAIIFLTIIVKIALFWLSNKSYVSMAKMRAISPKMEALREKHGDDRMAMSQAMMQLYKDEKVNPMAGCLPILLQMPIFLALYWVLVESVELRHAPWILWIKDLSAMDPWFILPIIMMATMYFQQLLNPQPTDPMQAKMMKIMPLIFGVFMLFFPAGLVLYWTVNNLFSMAHQQFVNQRVKKQINQHVS